MNPSLAQAHAIVSAAKRALGRRLHPESAFELLSLLDTALNSGEPQVLRAAFALAQRENVALADALREEWEDLAPTVGDPERVVTSQLWCLPVLVAPKPDAPAAPWAARLRLAPQRVQWLREVLCSSGLGQESVVGAELHPPSDLYDLHPVAARELTRLFHLRWRNEVGEQALCMSAPTLPLEDPRRHPVQLRWLLFSLVARVGEWPSDVQAPAARARRQALVPLLSEAIAGALPATVACQALAPEPLYAGLRTGALLYAQRWLATQWPPAMAALRRPPGSVATALSWQPTQPFPVLWVELRERGSEALLGGVPVPVLLRDREALIEEVLGYLAQTHVPLATPGLAVPAAPRRGAD